MISKRNIARVLYFLAALLLVVFLINGLGANRAAKAGGEIEELKVKKLTITNAEGEARIVLTTEPVGGGPKLSMFDENGEVRMVVGVGQEGEPELSMFDENRKIRIKLGVNLGFGQKEAQPRINLYGPNGEGGVSIAADSQGPRLVLFDGNGKARVGIAFGDISLYGSGGGNRMAGFSILNDQAGTLVVREENSGSTVIGGTNIGIADKNENIRIRLGLFDKGPGIFLFDKQHNPVWGAP